MKRAVSLLLAVGMAVTMLAPCAVAEEKPNSIEVSTPTVEVATPENAEDLVAVPVENDEVTVQNTKTSVIEKTPEESTEDINLEVSDAVMPSGTRNKSEIIRRLEELKGIVPNENYFSANGKACTHDSGSSCSNCEWHNAMGRLGYTSPYSGKSYTCYGFARFVWEYLFDEYYVSSNCTLVAQANISDTTQLTATLAKAAPGDAIELYSNENGKSFRHIAIVVGTSGTTVNVCEGNYSVPNRIHWGAESYKNVKSIKIYRNATYNPNAVEVTSAASFGAPFVTNITQTTAHIEVPITRTGTLTEVGVNWGTTSAMTNAPLTDVPGKVLTKVYYDFGSNGYPYLSSGTTYYYQFYAKDSSGNLYKSEQKTFATNGAPSPNVNRVITCSHLLTIPANTAVQCYASYDSTTNYRKFNARSSSYKLTSDQYIDMSDGTRKYHVVSGDGYSLWFPYKTIYTDVAYHTYSRTECDQNQHPHPLYSVCDCGYKHCTYTSTYVSSCLICNPPQYEVTLNANGGTVDPTKITVTYNTVYGELPKPTRSGYTFNNWSTAQTGGTIITSATYVAITANQTLYAQWTKNATPTPKPATPTPKPATPTPKPTATPTATPTAKPTATPKPESGVNGFVTRLYKVCMNRTPDAGGKGYWVNKLTSKQSSGAEVASGFIFSDEFKGKNYCNTDFVKQLYRAFMGREYDAGGLKDWVNKLNSGTKREEVFNGFAQSNEFKKICASYGIELGSPMKVPEYGTAPNGACNACGAVDGVTGFVTRLYKVCLGRTPDKTGLDYWCTPLRQHTNTGAATAHGFIFSDEFTGKKYSNADYVEHLYEAFMGRGSDAGGKADWVGQLNAGKSREDVFNGFVGSDEFSNICNSYGITRG